MSEPSLKDLLVDHRDGDRSAFSRIVPLVYEDLRRLARQQLARLRPGSTLDTTALVNEAYLKLVDAHRLTARDRGHFFAIAATAMRQILVDHVRQRTSAKRGGGIVPLPLHEVEPRFEEEAELLLTVDAALDRLREESPQLAKVFECRFFLGLDEEDTAEATGVSLRTVQRHWHMSRAWLRRELTTS